MLTLLIGKDWTANTDAVFSRIAQDVASEQGGRILIVPELVSHDAERRLCARAGDTASRFAEVLSFTRLARRVAESVGHGTLQCLDDGGRIVAMASATRQLHSKLKAYASVETNPEFLSELVDAVDEFKRCCITSADLMGASKQTQGSLAQKLEELALLVEAYDAICEMGKKDPADQMTWLLEQLEDSDFAQKHVFYIDGFPDFTRQHLEILTHLIKEAPQVVVSINCDEPGSAQLAFEKTGDTAKQILQIAKRFMISCEVVSVTPQNDTLSAIHDRLFQGKTVSAVPGSLRTVRTGSLYEEAVATAEHVMSLVRAGARYRDISVVCSDISAYKATLQMIFDRCGLPIYFSGTEDVLEMSAVAAVLDALEAALGGFEQNDVLRYLKSILSPVDQETCDRLENYAYVWSINGNRWLYPWTNHPEGLGGVWTEQDEASLQEMNAARELVIEPLVQLRDAFRKATNVRQQVCALYAFLEQIGMSQRLAQFADTLDEKSDNRSAQVLNQLWDILLTALEQLHDTLGETAWDSNTFTRLLRLLLSQYDVGTIPTVLDTVSCGPVSAMRCHRTKHLIVMGALEGALPGYSGSAGILTDRERTELRLLGVPLTGGATEGLQAEFAEIYGVFCSASESIYISCPDGQPSFLFQRLCRMSGREETCENLLGPVLSDKTEAGAYLARHHARNLAKSIGLVDDYMEASRRCAHELGTVGAENIASLYGTRLNLSASQIDKHADCRLSYFLKYGLRVKEIKSATVDPAEFGTYIHAVLEQTARRVMELGGFHAVDLDRTLQIAMEYSQAYADERFSQLSSERAEYLFNRNIRELEMIVEDLWYELSQSQFAPVAFELSFGNGDGLPAIEIPGSTMAAQVRGFVDRVDKWQSEGASYFRVVDYKTGKKDFDYCDVLNGLGLQMLLYLFALEQGGQDVFGEHSVAAGVQYFPARAPLVPSDGAMSEEEAAVARQKLWKRSGLLLKDEDVLQAMEQGEKPIRMSYSRKKDGTLSGDLADRDQMKALKKYIIKLLSSMVDEIASGNVAANPYTRGSAHNPCVYCPYGSICHKTDVPGRRNFKTVSAQSFWEEIGKEVGSDG